MTTTIQYQGRQARRSGSEQRRVAILEAALRIIVREGIRNVRHRAVAREAEVPLSATTYYFKDIGDLISDSFTLFAEGALREIIEPFQRQVFALLDSFGGLPEDDEACERLFSQLADMIGAYLVSELNEQRDHLIAEQAFMQEAILDKRLAQLAKLYTDKQLEAMTEACRKLGSPEPEMDAEFALANIWALERQMLLAGEADPVAIRRRALHMLRFITGRGR